MAKYVLRTHNCKKVVIDVDKDIVLYHSPVNPPNTGTRYTRGTDLLAHIARSGNVYFYFNNWSMWEGDEDSFELVDKDTAEEFLIDKAGLSGWARLDEREIEKVKKFGFDLMEETA